jgi:hypothetical protein
MGVRHAALAATALAVAMWAPGSLRAQSLEQRVFAKKDATVRLAYATRPGVYGNGSNNISFRDGQSDDWTSDCESGPAHVTIRVAGGELTEIKTRVGGRWVARNDVTDLGTVPASEAAQLFLALARRNSGAAEDAVFPAIIADSAEVWPGLMALARDPKARTDARKSAVFWVGQEAASAATRGLAEVVGDKAVDREVRESAVFALSQRPDKEGVPALIAVARTSDDPTLRKRAIFWLGQTEDPRALAYFEDVLSRAPGR